MSATASSVFISRIRQLPVMDASGDQVGRIRDVVISHRAAPRAPRVKGLVVELFARHRVFLPMVRVHSIDAVQAIIGGVVNTRRFERRDSEVLVIESLFDTQVTRRDGQSYRVFDIAMRPVRSREWELSEVALRSPGRISRFGRGGHTTIVEWHEIRPIGPAAHRGTDQLLAQLEDMKAADVAKELYALEPDRRAEIVSALDDETLADAIQELPEEEQVEVLEGLEPERAADILEEMDPDDAADLINELDPAKAEELLGRMEPDEAEDVRRLMHYSEFTAGGMMTPEPVILAHDARVADALAVVRNPDFSPALAGMVFVCRSPLETPTGRFLGGVHIQRLLREPPSTLVSALVDGELAPLSDTDTLAQVARYFATYNLVIAPVVDAERRLIGAITVDDVVDHMLPEDWREEQLDDQVDDDGQPEDSMTTRAEVAHGPRR